MNRILYLLGLALILIALNFDAIAQTPAPIRSEAAAILRDLIPPDNAEFTYKLDIRSKTKIDPKNFRLDLVYKIGHYEFEYVAVRFERSPADKDVNVTYFSSGSALGFYRKYAKDEFVKARTGTIAPEEFDRLLGLALTLFDSDIREIQRKDPAKFGVASKSVTYSSGDGSIAIKLSDGRSAGPLINESGTLISGDLRSRVDNGFDELRVHLFWKIFFDRLQQDGFLRDLDAYTAESMAIGWLGEKPIINEYVDYYRQAPLVHYLGRHGTTRAIATLEKIRHSNGLDETWSKYLASAADEAIASIKRR